LVMFVILAFLALAVQGTLTPALFYGHVITLLIANIIAVVLVVVLSFAISILTFQKGLDPGNFVIPIETAFAASITTIAALVAVALMSLGL